MADFRRGRNDGMPYRDVTTIRDLIYYQCAKTTTRGALHASDGTAAKTIHYGFIKQTFRDLQVIPLLLLKGESL